MEVKHVISHLLLRAIPVLAQRVGWKGRQQGIQSAHPAIWAQGMCAPTKRLSVKVLVKLVLMGSLSVHVRELPQLHIINLSKAQ